MRRASALVTLCALALAVSSPAAARGKGNRLMRIVSPSGHGQAAAHPFVNVVVRFGTEEGTPDPSTFKARLGGVNVTPLFESVVENGKITGMRAAISPALLITGPQRANRLRLEVRGRAGKHRLHDIDRLRFAAADVADQPPVANLLVAADVVLPNVPIQFDGTQSHDPESDEITYHWEFGDGSTSSDPRPVHAFTTDGDVTVRLAVSDGQFDGNAETKLLGKPKLKPGRTPGIIKLTAASALEFGGVPLGTTGTQSFTVRNDDTTPTSELPVNLGTSSDGFATDTDSLDLGPGESATVNLTFTPGVTGHQWSRVTLVANASNQVVLDVLTHGYGGGAPGTGPIPTADPAFFDGTTSTQALFPSGLRVGLDDSVHSCQNPGGAGTGDYCLTDADCSVNGGTCPTTGTCIRGDRAGQPCSSGADCPNGFGCTSALPFFPVDVCGDGAGGVVLLSDDGTFTDQTNSDAELSVTLMHVTFDANGQRTGAQILGRLTSGTTQVTCDAIPPAQGGQAYLAEYRAVTSPANCFRDAREALVARRKTTGADNTLMSRIDAAENLPECEDYDPATDLKVTPDGSTVFASLPNTGLWRIRPTPLLMLGNFDDFFAVHPDGSVVVVRSTDVGANGLLRVYKIAPDQAVTGAPNLNDLTPCATFQVPNNGGRTILDTTYAVDRTAPGSIDGTILVSFVAFGAQSALPRELTVRGTVAFTSPGTSDTCTPIGLVNLELLDDLSF